MARCPSSITIESFPMKTVLLITALLTLGLLFTPAIAVEESAVNKTLINQGKQALSQWEYKLFITYNIAVTEEAEINKLGREGWELVSINNRVQDRRDVVAFYFKRPLR